MHGGQHGHRTPPEDRGGAGRTPKAANTARTDAGLRARARTGLGDCQSKGWARRQRDTGSPCQTMTPCQSDCLTQSPAPHQRRKCRSPALAPCPSLPGNAGPCRDRLSIPEYSGHEPHQRLISISGHCRPTLCRKCGRKSPSLSPRSPIGRWRKVAPMRKPSPRDGPLPGRTDRGEWKPLVRRYRRVSGTLGFWRRPGPVTAENYGFSLDWTDQLRPTRKSLPRVLVPSHALAD